MLKFSKKSKSAAKNQEYYLAALNYWTQSEVCLSFEDEEYTLSETDFTIIMLAAAAS